MNSIALSSALKTSAFITGISLIAMALIAGFAYGFVYTIIYVPLDAESSSQTLLVNFDAYKYGIIAWTVIVALDVIVSVGIYSIYKKTQQRLAFSTSSIRIIYTLFLIFAVYQLAVPLMDRDEIINGLYYMEYFAEIWSYGLIIFGLHLIGLSLVCYQSKFTPNIVAALLFAGGLSYVLIESLKSFSPGLSNMTATLESALIAPMILGELSFAVWLIMKPARFSG